MIFERMKSMTHGTVLPGTRYSIKGVGNRRGTKALIYRIPNRRAAEGYYEKGITEKEFEDAYKQLVNTGAFTRKWFSANLTACAKEGPCNFIAIGKAFVLLGLAKAGRGKYTQT